MATYTAERKSFNAGAALKPARLCKLSAGSGTQVEYNGAGELRPVGVTDHEAFAAGEALVVRLWSSWSTYIVEASGIISVGGNCYADANGRVTAIPTGNSIGRALTAASAAGQFIEIIPDHESGATQAAAPFGVPLDQVRAPTTLAVLGNSAGTPSGALGLTPGTFGSASPILVGEAASNNSKSNAGRFLFTLPREYAAGEAITCRVRARITGDVEVAQTIDLVAHKADGAAGVGADLVATAAAAVTDAFANYDFEITPTGLAPGDVLDLSVTGAANDTGGAANKLVQISAITMLLDVVVP
ncbi:MAG TPA: DUF2190 family protein [Phycisphaerae bacterium]|nr:DUF2190 family protein [Phycisphaerae bacterium]